MDSVDREPGCDDITDSPALDLAELRREEAERELAARVLAERDAAADNGADVSDVEDPGDPDYAVGTQLRDDTPPPGSYGKGGGGRGTGGTPSSTSQPPPWPEMPTDAYYGPLGDAARAIQPLTEADPVAVLIQLLVAFGNAVGRGPRIVNGNVRQWANLFTVVVAESSKARKGTSWANAREVIGGADETWALPCIKSGLSSGEGVIHSVRDPVMKREPIREGGKRDGRVIDYQDVEDDPGVTDKRLLVVEGEFARALKVAGRKDNVLSAVLRDAYDTGSLSVLTKAPYKATGAHLSVIGHITRDELKQELSACDAFNGFANRFLWVCARRSKLLPFGEWQIGDVAAELTRRLASAVRAAKAHGNNYPAITDQAFREHWKAIYPDLSRDRKGLTGSVLARAETQVLRLALVYALADEASTVGVAHLTAALAVWRYCEESARFIFGDKLGDPVADETLRALRDSMPGGMTREEIRDHHQRNVSAARQSEALKVLVDENLAYCQKELPRGGKGRPAERWFASPTPHAENAVYAVSPPDESTYRVNGVNRVTGSSHRGVP